MYLLSGPGKGTLFKGQGCVGRTGDIDLRFDETKGGDPREGSANVLTDGWRAR